MNLVKRFRWWVYDVLKVVSPRFLDWICPYVQKSCDTNWRQRTKVAKSSPDNLHIPRVADAGKIIDGWQIMHNGLKVKEGSYYSLGASKLIRKNRGVHEPQEERVFQEVLKVVPPGSTMIELGAYWAFYSMWFCKMVPGGRAYMVEPMEENFKMGQANFAANAFKGHFTRGYVGQTPGKAEDGIPIVAIDPFVAEQGIDRIAILHSDIQGFELDMLHGAEQTIKAGKIGFYFISTHSEELHQACERFLNDHGLITLASASPAQSFSVDGILVCRSPEAPMLNPIDISKRELED